MTRLLIADDEPAPREQLADALTQAWPDARIVAQAEHGADAWDQWLAHEPDVCFLDIRMPGLSGIDVARRIAGRCPVVFVTAHGDHALQAAIRAELLRSAAVWVRGFVIDLADIDISAAIASCPRAKTALRPGCVLSAHMA